MPVLPGPIEAPADLVKTNELTPNFLNSLESRSGGTAFSSRHKLHILVSDPVDVYQVIVSDSDSYLKGDEEVALSKAIGWGLIGFEGDVHKLAQRSASPALRPSALSGYLETIRVVVKNHLGQIENQKNGVSLRSSLRNLSQESAERSLFGNSVRDVDFSYQQNVFNLNSALFGGEAIGSDGGAALRLIKEYEISRRNISKHVSKMIESWRTSGQEKSFLIDYIFGQGEFQGNGFDEFHQQVSVFLQAATETTASLASWAIMLLSDNRDYWLKLKDEWSNAGPLDTYESISDLKLLNSVIDESLRLYPPAWVIPRVANRETLIGENTVLPGTRVIASPYVSHRLEKCFPDAGEFKPERWLDVGKAVPRGAYFPFGLGNRICIGERYGKLTVKLILLAALERNIGLESDHKFISIDNHSLLLNPGPEIKVKSFSLQ